MLTEKLEDAIVALFGVVTICWMYCTMEEMPFYPEEWMIYGIVSWAGFLYSRWYLQEALLEFERWR